VTDQLAFFVEPRARAVDPATSHAAAAQVTEPGWTEFRILAAYDSYGPLTDDELCEALPEFYGPTLKTARSRLTKRGLLEANGTRPSFRGRDMTVWTPTPEEA
jgi:hypothetical protein